MKRRMKDQPLDSFTRSYIETALWSSMDNANDQGGEPLDANYSASDIDPETMAQMIADAYSFQERNAELLTDSGLSDKRAGHYFWLSRNGHGSGFFDEDLDALQDAAKRYGEFDLYVGDDGVIYGSPLDQRGGGVNEARRGPDPSRPYPRPVDRSTFLNTPEDMQWLRDVHLHDLDLQTFHSAILYGNEDSPHQIKVFRSNNPTVRDSFVTYSRDIDGFFRKSSGRVGEARHERAPSGPQWVPPALASEGITPTMLELILSGMGEHARIRPGQSVVYDRAYAALREGGYIVLKRATPGLSSYGDYYVLTDKGADLNNKYHVELRKLAGPTTREAPPPGRDRVHWKGDFSNNPRSGTIEISGDDGYAIVRWDDGKTERVPTSLFSTPRWSVERRGGPRPPPAAGPQPIPAPAPAPTRSAHKPPEHRQYDLHLIAVRPSSGKRHVNPVKPRLLGTYDTEAEAQEAGRTYLRTHPDAWLQTQPADQSEGGKDVEART